MEKETNTSHDVLILYGSQTGTAKEVSEEICRELICRHLKPKFLAIDKYDMTSLPKEEVVIFVVSTAGQGEPPDNMRASWQFLLRKDLAADSLKKVKFSVFGLGDSVYDKFNAMARKLNQRLRQLGASEFHQRGLADYRDDFGYESEFHPWLNALWESLAGIFPDRLAKDPLDVSALLPPHYKVKVLDQKSSEVGVCHLPELPRPAGAKREVVLAPMVSNRRTTPDDHFRHVRHVEFDFSGTHLTYEPGDVAIMQPFNDREVARNFIELMGWNTDWELEITLNPDYPGVDNIANPFPKSIGIVELFVSWLDLHGTPNRQFFRMLQHFAKDEQQKHKIEEFIKKTSEGRSELHRYAMKERRTFPEIFWDFDSAKPSLEYMIEMIGMMVPREFSITSHPVSHPGRLQICFALVEYETPMKREKVGVYSNFLVRTKITEDTDPADIPRVPLWIKHGTMYVPEEKNTPVIMVGPGTGISPLRSLIHERILSGEPAANNILVYGCCYRDKDFHHKEEMLNFQKEGKLTIFAGFSREQERKVYVQHTIAENAEFFKPYFAAETIPRIYVTGASKDMPREVELAFARILADARSITVEEATGLISALKKKGLYVVEAW
eukprot:CAMPEP_0115006120 /NCGR_PEP_ID=MMETSP0216-20121206/20294_1 /TAXON_ID=223996 /ORGANISM="Protocruzia adherens, Strain Boccale" /LENGTH=610 /DNA_ID=CAMNT_0002372609 /DNA_START=43 /DNA_END=1875 /DNA_ORIENTATION=+